MGGRSSPTSLWRKGGLTPSWPGTTASQMQLMAEASLEETFRILLPVLSCPSHHNKTL